MFALQVQCLQALVVLPSHVIVRVEDRYCHRATPPSAALVGDAAEFARVSGGFSHAKAGEDRPGPGEGCAILHPLQAPACDVRHGEQLGLPIEVPFVVAQTWVGKHTRPLMNVVLFVIFCLSFMNVRLDKQHEIAFKI